MAVWVYEGQIKIEYQTTPLSLFTVTFEPDHKHIAEVKNPRRIETHFRSPQLDLWQFSDTGWLLALRRPAYAKRERRQKVQPQVIQLALFDLEQTG